jgi:outer membrane protein OmpA-like peptidoglycan-associated protein
MRTERVLAVILVGCAARAPQRPMQLRRVILYQNGIGYFERTGHVASDTVHVRLARGELDDVLKTLTVIDRLGGGVATVDVPTAAGADRAIALGVHLGGGRVHDVQVSYAVPTPTWKAAYRVVLDDHAALLQGWAMVNNASQDDWNGVQLTLATGAPMSYALDLHTPQYASRPDATGKLVSPTLTGVVEAEAAGYADRDGDGIPDSEDKCPDEPETYNGNDDGDGCPDRGRVVVASAKIEILDNIYFERGSGEVAAASQEIIEAIAATLLGHPEIRKVEIGGHAGPDESDPWGVSSRRAAAVRAVLVEHGVPADRLVVVPYGATQSSDGEGDAARAKNRRVEFHITQYGEVRATTKSAGYDPQTAKASVHTATRPVTVAGAVRYVLAGPVSIPRGASSMVSILNTQVTAEDALLFRPDAGAPGSDRHPFRAVRLANGTGYTLEPGPIAIFARGSFVGDSLLQRLDLGETAWVPYALEGGTTVTTAQDAGERPLRIVSIHHGVVEVENSGVRTTKYTVAAGRDPAKRIYVRHARVPGYTIDELPPGTIDHGDADLVPMPLQPGKTSVLALEEHEPRRRSFQLLDGNATAVGLYLEGSHLPPKLAEQLRAVLALRKEMGAIEDDRAAARDRLGELSARAEDVRRNLRAIDKVRGTDELRKKLVANLAQLTADADALAKKLGVANDALAAARAKLEDSLPALEL